ncbi:hypothetical protein GWP40_01760 [Treponema vincentii]|uniref:hypothetical protein n=1 Tax=Treponema TaxID=157 RepID=UPI001BAED1F0|nr:hypothetical protein [Treponema vincentii]QUY17258.1 hypothetical protein GWP40_01760 [Treponema vincentii]
MTDAAKHLLKKYAALAGILLVFLASFLGLSYLRKKADTRYLTAAAEKLCRAYPGFKGRQITVSWLDNTGLSGLPFKAVLSASYSGREAFVFMLPLTGKYGVYPAVFFYERSIGCVFCGLAGIDALPVQAERYGITPSTIAMYRNRIDILMKKQEG